MPIKFRFRWVPFAAMVIAMAIGVAAGQWQSRRAAEKEAIEVRLQARGAASAIDLSAVLSEPQNLEYARLRVKGEFVRDWPVFLDNRPYQGRAGFYLLMPMKLAGLDQAVLVARGWFPRDVKERTRLPHLDTPTGIIEMQGVARSHAARLYEFKSAQVLRPGAIVQNAEIAEFAKASKLPLLPLLIEQTSDTHDGLVRDWPRPSGGADKHRAYAFQWHGLAATAFVFFLVTGFRRGTRQG